MFRLLFGVAAAVMIAASASAATTSPEAAQQFIQSLGDRTINVLHTDKPTEAKTETVRGLLREGLDLRTIGRFVLGLYWKDATPEQRADYETLFARWVVEAYSARLAGADVRAFSVLSAEPVGQGDILVNTKVDRSSGTDINWNWRVRDLGEGPKIIDLTVDGLSMAVTQRSEFASVVSREGIDGLLSSLRTRLAQLAKKDD